MINIEIETMKGIDHIVEIRKEGIDQDQMKERVKED